MGLFVLFLNVYDDKLLELDDGGYAALGIVAFAIAVFVVIVPICSIIGIILGGTAVSKGAARIPSIIALVVSIIIFIFSILLVIFAIPVFKSILDPY